MWSTRKLPIRIPKGVLRNVFSLYGLYCSNYILALISVPYLTRVLGPSDWGLVAFVQAFCSYLLVIVEFGFTFTGAREAARSHATPEKLSEVVADVCAGKAVLVVLCLGIATLAQFGVRTFHEHALLFWSGVFWALVHGYSLLWYFQGLEKMRIVAVFDMAAKGVAVLATLIVVRSPKDDWKVLGLQGVAGLACAVVQFGMAYRNLPLRFPHWGRVVEALRRSSKTFAPRNASLMYTLGNAFILGLFAPPWIVGFYSGAERISRAITGLLTPASEAVYPHLSHVASLSRDRTRKLARLGLFVMAGIGTTMGLAIYLLSPHLVPLLLGHGYEPAIRVLQILSFLAPVIAIRNVFAIHWMLPLDLDSHLNMIVVGTGVLNVVLAVLLAPKTGAVGVAWAGVLSQALGAVGVFFTLHLMRLNPLERKKDLLVKSCA
jgi:polysaccharide transporter, PST family